MTSNPARDLADLLNSWNGEATTITQNRADAIGANPGTLDFWIGINSAVVLLDRYRQLIDSMEARGQDVDHYREQLVRLHNYIYAPDTAWNSGQNGRPPSAGRISPTDYALLKACADALEGRYLGTGQPDAAAVTARLREAMDATTDLPETSDRDRLRWMIDQALAFAGDIGRFGAETVVATAGEVAQVFGAAAEAETDLEKRRRFQNIKDGLVVAILGNLGTEAGKLGVGAAPDLIKGLLGG